MPWMERPLIPSPVPSRSVWKFTDSGGTTPMAILEASSNDNTVIKQKGLYMRKTIVSGIIASVFGLLAPQILQAQGTTYLSNLEQSSASRFAAGSDSLLAATFETGTNAGGYVINSIQLAMSNASGNPSGFQVMLYRGAGGGGTPGTLLGTLDRKSTRLNS